MPNCKFCGKPLTGGYLICADCLPQAPIWVSVRDRLPVAFQQVLLAHKDGRVVQGYLDGGRMWRIHGGDRTKRVTHWMPLPDAPKEETRWN